MQSVFHLFFISISLFLLLGDILRSALSDTIIETLVGSRVKMPCDILQKNEDSIEFIFWYKNDGVTALYTLDSRERKLSDAIHMKNETYSDRVQFYVDENNLYLELSKIKEEDTGAYFCRIDYQWSATELKKINLIVVVPPNNVIIRDEAGQEIHSIAGPYKEKSDVSFICEAEQGFPSPNVTWWKDNKLWDNTFAKVTKTVRNEMRLTNINRSELFATFHCKAQNTKLLLPVTKTIVLDLYLYPLSVRITNKMISLSSGQTAEITCESIGSRPSAKITWLLNGTHLSDHTETVHDNVTSSVLVFKPKIQHHRTSLVCMAENTKIYNSRVEDIKLLNITYLPRLSLKLIKENENQQPKENDFVRLICEINANPPISKLNWLFNDLPLSHNESRTDIISGNTLVFKHLRRHNQGRYRCFAVNKEGTGFSPELILNISHAPVCKENQQITYVVELNKSVVVRCEVEAIPTDVTFKWEFSNTHQKHYNLQHDSDGVISNATYRPVMLSDYGTLFCWANNSIGHQQSSCFFTVIAPSCQAMKTEANASTSSREENRSIWNFSTIIIGVGAAFSIIIVSVLCIVYLKKIHFEKKQRPTEQPELDEEIGLYSRVHYHDFTRKHGMMVSK